ncbi:MAG: NAD-dependent epimerase/dehydratase family protein [Candidatus Blackburnbacteria bacterium]|nr:NAD-dependent epimerase/dehydratase family protein [Candidatus Blackburnbacteria bacterium]
MKYHKVLVTGGAGFIGSHTIDLLLKKGYSVKILDNLQERVHPKGKPDYIPNEVEFIKGDVANPKDLLKGLKGVDAVYHLAAYQDYLPDFSHFIHTNTESSALMFELILQHKLPIKKIIFASSQAVAGDGKWKCSVHGKFWAVQRPLVQLERGEWDLKCPNCGKPAKNVLMTEDIARPTTTYGVSKYVIELLADVLGKKHGIPTVCMRYTYVQGPRNSIYNAYSGIARVFAQRILNNKRPVLFEDGLGLKDYVSVYDVAAANLLVLEDNRANNRVFFVGSGRGYTNLSFAKIILRMFDSSLEPEIPGIFRLGDTRSTVSSIKAISKLGWKPKVSLEKSMQQYKEYLESLGPIEDRSDEAFKKMMALGVIRKTKKT